MRILVLNWKDPAHPAAGGAEIYTWEVVRRWVAWGHDVTLFAASVAGRPAEEVIDGVRIVRGGGRLTVYRTARRYYERNRGQFDFVVDEVNTRPFFAPRFVTDAPVLALIHQVADDMWRYEAPWPFAFVGRQVLEPRWLAAYRDVPVLTLSASSRQSLQRYGLQQVKVAPVGVTLPDPMPDPRPKEPLPTVVFLARLTAAKRPQDAIAAVRLVREHLPETRLWVIGTGPLEERLRATAPDWVEFHGWVDECRKFDLLARAHAIVVTSVREGWGLIVDEAAAVGTPSFAYDVPGLHDSVPAARGTLTQPEPESLADELVAALPRLVARGQVPGWSGGAVHWYQVARRILDEMVNIAGLSAEADLSVSLESPDKSRVTARQ